MSGPALRRATAVYAVAAAGPLLAVATGLAPASALSAGAAIAVTTSAEASPQFAAYG